MIVGLASAYLVGFGFLSGVVVERVRFDVHRTAALARLQSTEERVRARLMDLEGRAEPHPRRRGAL